MSTYWDIHCRTCDDSHHFEHSNHCEKELLEILQHRKLYAALEPIEGSVEVRFPQGYIDISWFVEHHEHDLVVKSEYGEILEPGAIDVKTDPP